MGEKINNILKGEIISSVFYILLGLCLILIPTQTVDVICKVVFGLILIGAGIYHIYIYIRGKAKATIMDLLSGVVVFVLGVFLFMTPSIVIKLLPWMLSAFVLVDSLWKFKGAFSSEKRRTRCMERASDRQSCFYCTGNRDAVWKISEDHDSADLFRLGAGV